MIIFNFKGFLCLIFFNFACNISIILIISVLIQRSDGGALGGLGGGANFSGMLRRQKKCGFFDKTHNYNWSSLFLS